MLVFLVVVEVEVGIVVNQLQFFVLIEQVGVFCSLVDIIDQVVQ